MVCSLRVDHRTTSLTKMHRTFHYRRIWVHNETIYSLEYGFWSCDCCRYHSPVSIAATKIKSNISPPGTGVAWLMAKYTNRTVAGIYTLVLSCIGIIMMFTIPAHNYGARYGGYILTLQCNFIFHSSSQEPQLTNQVPICVLFIITFMTAGVGGTTKKLAFGAAYQLGYAVGNIIGPQTYRADDAPTYYVTNP